MFTARRVAPVLPVRDVAAALDRFRALGFEAHAYAEGVHPGELVYGFVKKNDVELHVGLMKDLDPKLNTSACYLYVDDADALYEMWSKANVGGRLVRPQDTPYDLREFALVDVDGNLLRVGSPLTPRQ